MADPDRQQGLHVQEYARYALLFSLVNTIEPLLTSTFRNIQQTQDFLTWPRGYMPTLATKLFTNGPIACTIGWKTSASSTAPRGMSLMAPRC